MPTLRLLIVLVLLTGCTQDQQNQLSRKVVEFLDGNYLLTYANGSTSKTWTIKNNDTRLQGLYTSRKIDIYERTYRNLAVFMPICPGYDG